MLAIRMQRTGRKGHAQFRMVVQDSRRTPSSGNIVASLGSYDPHTKVAKLNVEKATAFLNNGAQPSDRVAALLQKEGVKMPSWVVVRTNQERTTRNTEKLRKDQPAAEVVEEVAETVVAEEIADEVVAEAEVDAIAAETEEVETVNEIVAEVEAAVESEAAEEATVAEAEAPKE